MNHAVIYTQHTDEVACAGRLQGSLFDEPDLTTFSRRRKQEVALKQSTFFNFSFPEPARRKASPTHLATRFYVSIPNDPNINLGTVWLHAPVARSCRCQ